MPRDLPDPEELKKFCGAYDLPYPRDELESEWVSSAMWWMPTNTKTWSADNLANPEFVAQLEDASERSRNEYLARYKARNNRETKAQTKREKYEEYLNSQEWAEKREECLEYYEHRCALCYTSGRLHVHHRTYDRLFDERPSDLIALCEKHHNQFHKAVPEYDPYYEESPF